MRLRQIADRIISKVEGGIVTDDSKYNYEFIYSLIHKSRAKGISMLWAKNNRINNTWTQKFVATYNKYQQDNDCMVNFDCPSPITLDDKKDGLLYVGSKDFNCNYTRIKDRGTLSSFSKYRYTKPSTNKPRVIYSDGRIEVWGDTFIEELMVDGIFNDPTKVPTFNREFDEYPADELLLSLIEEIIFKDDLRITQSTPIDVKSDSQATTSIPSK